MKPQWQEKKQRKSLKLKLLIKGRWRIRHYKKFSIVSNTEEDYFKRRLQYEVKEIYRMGPEVEIQYSASPMKTLISSKEYTALVMGYREK